MNTAQALINIITNQKAPIECPDCDGIGETFEDCPVCQGTGLGLWEGASTCGLCRGKGGQVGVCKMCKGLGEIDRGDPEITGEEEDEEGGK